MATPTIQDLRYLFYGGEPGITIDDAEYQFLLTAQANGVSALNLIELATAPSGRELAYAETDQQQSNITSVVDLTGLVLPDFTINLRPVKITCYLPYVIAVTNAATCQLQITDASNTVLSTSAIGSLAALEADDMRVEVRLTEPGEYSGIKARLVRISGTGTITVNYPASETWAFIEAIER